MADVQPLQVSGRMNNDKEFNLTHEAFKLALLISINSLSEASSTDVVGFAKTPNTE